MSRHIKPTGAADRSIFVASIWPWAWFIYVIDGEDSEYPKLQLRLKTSGKLKNHGSDKDHEISKMEKFKTTKSPRFNLSFNCMVNPRLLAYSPMLFDDACNPSANSDCVPT